MVGGDEASAECHLGIGFQLRTGALLACWLGLVVAVIAVAPSAAVRVGALAVGLVVVGTVARADLWRMPRTIRADADAVHFLAPSGTRSVPLADLATVRPGGRDLSGTRLRWERRAPQPTPTSTPTPPDRRHQGGSPPGHRRRPPRPPAAVTTTADYRDLDLVLVHLARVAPAITIAL